MHTFFVNTSDRVNTSRHELLFDNMASNNEVRMFNYKLETLGACADKISEIITRDDTISEVYNIIVYVEISERNEFALAAESVASLQIEEMLFSRLYDLGRKPNQALILFGESFTRDAEYGRGNEYKRNVRSAIWNMFPLPQTDDAIEVLKKVRSDYTAITRDNIKEFKNAVWIALTDGRSENALLKSENEFVKATIYEMAESIRNDNLDFVDLLDELYVALTNQKEQVQLPVTAEKVKYAHIRLEDSDFNIRNRTEYRILLYVFYCAISESIVLCKTNSDVGEVGELGITLGIDTIPDINWDYLSSELKERKVIFKKESEHIESVNEGFPMFNSSLLTNEKIISLSAEPPSLITEVRVRGGLTVSQLEKAVERTLNDVEEKNRNNEERITNYVMKVTDSFSPTKDLII